MTNNIMKQELLWLSTNANLGGSRYFAIKYPNIITVKSTTDWDFYAQNDREIENTLISRGYTLVFDNDNFQQYDGDSNLSKIYINYEYPTIQVLLRKDVKLYTKVIKSINPEFYRDYLWKSGPNYCVRENIQAIFNQLFETAK